MRPLIADLGPRICRLALALALNLPALAHAEERVDGPPLSYDIEVELDAERHILHGRERIHLENSARAPLNALYFHLYLNAFRDQRSVFFREGGSRLRGHDLGAPGSVDVLGLHTAQGADLLVGADRELIPGDFTQLRVHLPEPVLPGAALDLELTFRADLPELVARSGYAGDFYMVGQWFPKLAKLDNDGDFVSFPYHGFGEFFADFADYTFSVTVPERFVVAAGGERIEQIARGTTRTERYRATRVHDVAWAAYPYFETKVVQVGSVRVQLYAPRGYGSAMSRQATTLTAALPHFESRYGSYPYSSLTVIIPPPEGQGASGMEYPTLFVSDGPWWALPSSLPDPRQDIVSAHELAHQWFSGMIASDEVAYPMLDEGLAQWTSLDFLRAHYAAKTMWTHDIPVNPFEFLRGAAMARMRSAPSSLLAANKYTAKTLAPSAYVRPALVFERAAELHGLPLVTRAIGQYARAQRFRHPTPNSLFAAFDHALGSGFGSRTLRKALEASTLSPLPLPADKSEHSPSGFAFLPELFDVAFSALRWLGP